MTTEPTPSQLKIDGMPETEVLRIEGNVTVPKGTELSLEVGFKSLIECCEGAWQGTISTLNPDAESFMVEVKRTEYNQLYQQIKIQQVVIDDLKKTAESNDKAFSDLADKYSRLNKSYNMLKLAFYSEQDENESLSKEVNALKLRLKLKDSPIKAGLKRIWKWFKGLVGK